MPLLPIASAARTTRLADARPSRLPRTARYTRLLSVAAAITVGVVAVGAGAQPRSDAPPPVAAPAGGAPALDAQVGFEKHVELSPQQQEAEAELLIGQIQAAAGTTQRMLAQARLARDVVKTLCLNDKLSQVDVASRSATDRKASLHAAVGRGDRELSNHEFTILTVLKKRTEQLSAEANQCIGEEAAFIGATNVVTTVDTTLPGGDQTDMPPSVAPVAGPPVSVSSNQ